MNTAELRDVWSNAETGFEKTKSSVMTAIDKTVMDAQRRTINAQSNLFSNVQEEVTQALTFASLNQLLPSNPLMSSIT